MKTDKSQVKKRIIEILKDKTEFVLLFGSFNKESFKEDSDIDIALFLKDEFIGRKDEVRKDLLLGIDIDVDIIFLNNADPIISMQAITNGMELLVNNRERFNLYKARLLSIYADLKLSRKIIEGTMLNGRIYA